MTVGARIKARREELGMSQGDLAEKIGISRQAVSKAELHDDNITTPKVKKFANALGCSIEYLMGWEDNMKVPVFDPDHIFLIDKYSKLTPEHKRLIKEMIMNLLNSTEYNK